MLVGLLLLAACGRPPEASEREQRLCKVSDMVFVALIQGPPSYAFYDADERRSRHSLVDATTSVHAKVVAVAHGDPPPVVDLTYSGGVLPDGGSVEWSTAQRLDLDHYYLLFVRHQPGELQYNNPYTLQYRWDLGTAADGLDPRFGHPAGTRVDALCWRGEDASPRMR